MTILVYGRSTPKFEPSFFAFEKRIIFFDDVDQLFDLVEREICYQLVIFDCSNLRPVDANLIKYRLNLIRKTLLRSRFILRSNISVEESGSFIESGFDVSVGINCSDRELISRIQSVLRRDYVGANNDWVSNGAITISSKLHLVKAHGHEVKLSLTEFKLLELMMNNLGRAVSREEISQCLFDGGARSERIIDVHCFNLKRRLGDVASLIRTVRGYGYVMEKEAFIFESDREDKAS